MLYRLPLRPQVIVLPGFVLVAMLVALTFGLWSASLSVRYRDVAFAMAFLLQAMMYASPVIYPLNMVPPQLLPLYVLNPMTGVIQGFRWALLGSNEAPGKYFVLSIGLTIGFLIVGAFLVRRTERTMVDNL
jgi:lipopolysaccharide transport system permease protein